MTKTKYWLSPYGDKGWKLIKQGGERPTRTFDTKKEALEFAREFCRKQEALVMVQLANGSISQTIDYTPDEKPKPKRTCCRAKSKTETADKADK